MHWQFIKDFSKIITQSTLTLRTISLIISSTNIENFINVGNSKVVGGVDGDDVDEENKNLPKVIKKSATSKKVRYYKSQNY